MKARALIPGSIALALFTCGSHALALDSADWQSELHKANGQVSVYYSPFGAQPKMLADAQVHFAAALKNAEKFGPEHPGVAIVNLYWAGALMEPVTGPHATAALTAWRKCCGNRMYQKQLASAKSQYLLILKAHHAADVAKFQSATI